MTVAQEDAKTDAGRMVGIAKLVIELGTLWTVFGYVSVRAFCNYIGVALLPDLRVERYLEETYTLLVTLTVNVLTSIWFLLYIVVACIAAGVASIKWRKTRPASTKPAWSQGAVSLALVVCVSLSATGFGVVNRYFSLLPDSVLSGGLVADHLRDDSLGPFFATLALALLSCVCCYLLRPGRLSGDGQAVRRSVRVLFAIQCALSGLTALYVPMVFGASLHGKEVYIVRLQLEGGEAAVCGARILESPQRILVWNADNGIGRSQSIALSKVTRADYVGRPVALLNLAQLASRSSKPQPDCPLSGTPGQRP